MAAGTRVYNRTMEKQRWRTQVEQILSGSPESVKRYQIHDGPVLTEHQIRYAHQRASPSPAVHCYPKAYQRNDGTIATKHEIKASLRHAKKFPGRISRKDMAATVTDVEDFLAEERLWMCDAPDDELSYKKLMAQTAPVGFSRPTEEKRLRDDFVLHFPEYRLSGCFHLQ